MDLLEASLPLVKVVRLANHLDDEGRVEANALFDLPSELALELHELEDHVAGCLGAVLALLRELIRCPQHHAGRRRVLRLGRVVLPECGNLEAAAEERRVQNVFADLGGLLLVGRPPVLVHDLERVTAGFENRLHHPFCLGQVEGRLGALVLDVGVCLDRLAAAVAVEQRYHHLRRTIVGGVVVQRRIPVRILQVGVLAIVVDHGSNLLRASGQYEFLDEQGRGEGVMAEGREVSTLVHRRVMGESFVG